MSIFDLADSLARASVRFGAERTPRRSDAGKSRLPGPVDRYLRSLLLGQERPSVRALQRDLERQCSRLAVRPPSRATIYNAIARCPSTRYLGRKLPEVVRLALYNVDLEASIPGEQVAFYAFNYGDLSAASWAAGMPWLALYHAARMRGWRPKSQGLLLAAMHRRGIP